MRKAVCFPSFWGAYLIGSYEERYAFLSQYPGSLPDAIEMLCVNFLKCTRQLNTEIEPSLRFHLPLRALWSSPVRENMDTMTPQACSYLRIMHSCPTLQGQFEGHAQLLKAARPSAAGYEHYATARRECAPVTKQDAVSGCVFSAFSSSSTPASFSKPSPARALAWARKYLIMQSYSCK